jgi:hypothetical protein
MRIEMMTAVVAMDAMPMVLPAPGPALVGLRGIGQADRASRRQGGRKNNACCRNPKCTHDRLLLLVVD